MRLSIFVTLILGLLAAPAHAGIVSGALGFVLGMSVNQQDVADPSVIYVAPRLVERIPLEDQLNIRLVTKNFCLRPTDPPKTLQNLFSDTLGSAAPKYTILRIVQTISENPCSQFHFAYIEKEKVTPLESLPEQK